MRNAKKDMINKTALILSAIFPGMGQIYKREYIKGFNLITMQCIFIFFLFYPARMLFPLGVILVPTLWVFGVADAILSSSPGYSFPRWSGNWRYLRRRVVSLAAVIWVFVVIVFTVTATVIKHKLNPPKSTAVIVNEEPKLKLLTKREAITTPDAPLSNSNSTNAPSIIPVKELQNPQFEESTTTVSDVPLSSIDTRLVSVVAEPEQFSKVDGTRLEEEDALPYVIITGAFNQYRNAENLHIQLSRKGYQPLITSVMSNNNKRVHVVVISGFSTISVAKAITSKLKQEIDECRDCFIATLDSFIATLEKPIVSTDRLK